MKVRCISDNGESLRPFENEPIGKDVFGRFGASAYTRYGVEIGREYLVMGKMCIRDSCYSCLPGDL